MNCGNYGFWTIFFPYYASYLKPNMPDMTLKLMFSLYILLCLGVSLGSTIVNFIIFIFGYRKTVLLLGFTLFLSSYFAITSYNIIAVVIYIFTVGATRQWSAIITILFFTERITEKASEEYSKSLGGTALGSFIWAMILNHIVNPNNQGMDVLIEEYGEQNYYYDKSVYNNLYSFNLLFGFVSCLFFVIGYFLIPESSKFQGNMGNIYKAIFKGEKSLSQVYKDFSSSLNESLNSESSLNININAPKLNKKINKNREKNDNEQELIESGKKEKFDNLFTKEEKEDLVIQQQQQFWKELFSFKFILLYVLAIIRNTEAMFAIENFKIQGISLVNNDVLLNTAYALSGVMALFVKSFAGILWERQGMINCYNIAFLISFFIDFTYVSIIKYYPYLFLLTGVISRMNWNLNSTMNFFTIFSSYPAEKALKLAMFFDSQIFLSTVLMIIINRFLVTGQNFEIAYSFFVICDIVGLILLFVFLRPITTRNMINY